MVKVALFHCGFIYSGGGERIVLEEALGLKNRGYDVCVYAPTLDSKKCYPDLVKKLEVKTFLPSFIDNLPFKFALRMILTSFLAPLFSIKFKDTDIFIGANQPGAWIAFCIAKLLNKPYIIYLNQPNRLLYPRPVDREFGWYHTVADFAVLDFLINIFKPLISYFDKVSITKSNQLLVNGSYIKDIIENIYSLKAIDASAGSFAQPLSNLSRLRQRFKGSIVVCGKRIKKPYILITNRHDPQKRFDFVIEALSYIVKKKSGVILVIPGPHTLHTRKLIMLVKKLNLSSHVYFLGQIPETDLQRLYKYCSVYCYPAPSEDFGLGPLEAGGWAVPTVAWNHGGPTVTVVDGKTGFLVNPYEIKSYADMIRKLISNEKLCMQMGRYAYERTKNDFSWDRHINIIEKSIRRSI